MRLVDSIIVHCSATPPTMDVTAKDIDRWHRERGFLKIGYHFVIRRDGTIEDGRPVKEPGAHAKGHNRTSIGICLVGGVTKEQDAQFNFTHAQMGSLNSLVWKIKQDLPDIEITGHNDVSDKACPCFDVEAWFSAY